MPTRRTSRPPPTRFMGADAAIVASINPIVSALMSFIALPTGNSPPPVVGRRVSFTQAVLRNPDRCRERPLASCHRSSDRGVVGPDRPAVWDWPVEHAGQFTHPLDLRPHEHLDHRRPPRGIGERGIVVDHRAEAIADRRERLREPVARAEPPVLQRGRLERNPAAGPGLKLHSGRAPPAPGTRPTNFTERPLRVLLRSVLSRTGAATTTFTVCTDSP